MNILSIESSCDETAAAITRCGREVLCDEIFSQVGFHAKYGGVVPEIASRKHIEVIRELTVSALKKSGLTKHDLDAIAVTNAPGLIGALLVGVNFAKALAFGLKLPLIPVHHIRGHIAANYIAEPELEPPFLCLVVSGGHSLITAVKSYTEFEIIGTTRDDAAGECFDKAARIMGLGYPGGPAIDKLASSGGTISPERLAEFKLPIANVDGKEFDFSFSGVKTTVVNLVHNFEQKGEDYDKAALAQALTNAISDALLPRLFTAAERFGYGTIAVAGGVAANSTIRSRLQEGCETRGLRLVMPPLSLCADNAAMIGCQAYYEFQAGNTATWDLNAYAALPVNSEQ
ncbi:MAG: tRNA (adenosine(37)-N6)-threonylcarbamoyltransferase complex transferase subunit TsaD [Oscillospiraceae bacterium]|jgi:N6-L-threonylcarbamoyladenine synthase|nr:tRNA (adenosine(37)-N6)-threonylcarbamoyltransferase complex transferase subunit TsaD [Oscillospiraceae bacterium]